MDDKPRRTGVGLDDVFRLWTSVFEASRGVFDDSLAKDFIKFGSFDFDVASSVNLCSEFKEFSNVLTGLRASDEYWGVR